MGRWLLLWTAIAAIALTGCVDYGVTVKFGDANHGEIVQRVALGDRWVTLGDSLAAPWRAALERQAETLGGQVRSPDPQELWLSIPFANGTEFVEKFEQLLKTLAPTEGDRAPSEPPIRVSLHQQNFGIAVRNALTLEADLRSLASLTVDGQILVGAESLLQSSFALAAPVIIPGTSTGPLTQGCDRVIWPLQAGTLNHIEAVFWVPSWLGLGAIAIALICGLGVVLRDRLQG
ncbi:MAG: hypothetical protein Fur0042_13290 [Cyanophyceae cyanobacterium]